MNRLFRYRSRRRRLLYRTTTCCNTRTKKSAIEAVASEGEGEKNAQEVSVGEDKQDAKSDDSPDLDTVNTVNVYR